MDSNSSQSKGKKADWKATAEMVTTNWRASISREHNATDALQASGDGKGKGKGVDWHTTAETLTITPAGSLETPLWQEQEKEGAVNLAAAIGQLPELDEREVAEANHIQFSSRGTTRQAPPPPRPVVTMIWPKMEGVDHVGAYADKDVSNDEAVEVGLGEDANETSREPVTAIPLKKLKRKKNFPAGPVKLGRLEPEPVAAGDAIEERWECHECNLYHPIVLDGVEWNEQDPNVCQCCNHDRCSKCWDLCENNWRTQHCDGSAVEEA